MTLPHSGWLFASCPLRPRRGLYAPIILWAAVDEIAAHPFADMKIDLIDSNPADGERPEPERADGQGCIGRVGECGTNYPHPAGLEPGKPYFPATAR